MVTDKNLIGWREWVGLPDLGVERIRAKIDTGARSSSLHAYRIETFERDGTAVVRFQPTPTSPPVETVMVKQRTVRNPGGRTETRPVIGTRLRWNGRLWRIELNLTNRDEMGFRMLLGRQALRRLLVDSGRSYLGGTDPQRP